MPSQTFFNLSEEKRERLIQGAMKEFVEVPLHKASVSNIIINAKGTMGQLIRMLKLEIDREGNRKGATFTPGGAY